MTVAELADALALSGMGIRRHLSTLAAEGLVERSPCVSHGPGRPPAGWRLSATGMELFPRRYDALALDLLEELPDDQTAAAFARRNDKQLAQYRRALAACPDLPERVAGLAQLRDDAGYQAECCVAASGAMVLTENNCAVHRVAEHHPAVCAMELALMQEVLGPDVEVTRVAHAMAGDAVCSYHIKPGHPQAAAE